MTHRWSDPEKVVGSEGAPASPFIGKMSSGYRRRLSQGRGVACLAGRMCSTWGSVERAIREYLSARTDEIR